AHGEILARRTLSRYTPLALSSTPATPSALGRSPIDTYAMPSRMIRLTFHNAVTSEISEAFSALESASVEMVCDTPKTAHHVKNPGRIAGQPRTRQVPSANGRRNVNRPHTLMYSSSACPSRFIAVLRRTWKSAAASASRSHMVVSGRVQARAEIGRAHV